MSIATQPVNALIEYVKRLAATNPAEAVQIALAEADKEKAIAAAAQAEYRALAEVHFDEHGRIVNANLGGLWRLAQMYAGSAMVPKHYQQRPNDCFIACQMAFRLRVDPFAYMQASYVVHGKPGIEAKLSIAMLNTSGKIVGRVRYREERDQAGKMIACTAYAFDQETGEEVAARIPWDMVVAEGWLGKEGSKWKSMPEIMFHYRSATFLIRQYYPEVLMGMRTVDELEDIGAGDAGAAGGKPIRTLDDLTDKLAGPANGDGQGVPGVVETADLPDPKTVQQDPTEPLGTISHVGGEQDQETDGQAEQSDLLNKAASAFSVCDKLHKVGKLEETFRMESKEDAERAEVTKLANQTRERLRAANSQQKELPTT